MKKGSLLKAGAVAAAGCAGVSYILFDSVMNRSSKGFEKAYGIVKNNLSKADIACIDDTPKPKDERKAWFNECQKKEYTITNQRGFHLKGYLIEAENPTKSFVFCSHGYRSSGCGDFGIMAKFYHDLGLNVFLVDHQASGKSEGKYISFGHYESKDCLLWLDYLKKVFGEDITIILHGISMGAATVLLMSGDACLPQNVKCVISDCGFTTMQAEFEHAIKYTKLPKTPFLNIADIYNKFYNSCSFKDVAPIESVKRAKIPVLFIHGTSDDFVPTYMVHELFAACKGEKDLLLVKGAGHANSYKTDTPAYEDKVKEFIKKYAGEQL